MLNERSRPPRGALLAAAEQVSSLPEIARLLRELRRWEARSRSDTQLTYRELAAKTGWSAAAIWDYFAGRTLPPTDRFDDLVRLLGATPAEQGALATARDRVEESRRWRPGGSAMVAVLVPRQLPLAVRQFVGREGELEVLSDLVDQADPTGATVVILTIGGMAGVGKTALAVYWAHLARDRFPDGQLYVNLRGFDPTGQAVRPTQAVRGFLDAFGVPPERIPAELEPQAALYRSLLADRRVLVVLDNARDAEQVRPLLPGTAGCAAVVTSRDQLSSLVATDGAQPLALDPLPAADARRLLARRLGHARTGTEPEAVATLVDRCAGHPLALSIVAARAAANPRFPLRALADQLEETRGGLDAFAGNDPSTDVRAVFSWSYRAIDPDAARMFRLLSLHPGPDITVPAAASLAAEAVGPARRALAALASAHLLVEQLPGRYAMHDLVRAYAGELAQDIDPEAERRGAIARVLDHYLHTGHCADRLLEPHGVPIDLDPPEPGVSLAGLADYDAALAWFTAERRVLLAAIGQAVEYGLDRRVWQLAWTAKDFLIRGGYWHDGVAAQSAGLAAADRLGDVAAQARAHNNLGSVHGYLGRYDEAQAEFLKAVELNRRQGSVVGQAVNHVNLSSLANGHGRHAEALHHAERSADLYREAVHFDGYAYALNEVGLCHSLLGDHERALECLREALDINTQLGDRRGQAECWDNLGRAHHQCGEHLLAIDCYGHALDINQEIGRRSEEAATLTALGEALDAAGRRDEARAAWTRALPLLDEVGHPDGQKVRSHLAA